uniref:Uncharacterized protein n=1 Tax=Arundo donax TaxID=35708 RepID=A0A0A9FAR5_ARUDO
MLWHGLPFWVFDPCHTKPVKKSKLH